MAILDRIKTLGQNMSSPATRAFVITPHDTNELPEAPKSLHLSEATTIKVDMLKGEEGDAVTLELSAGYHPLRVRRVWATPAPTGVITALV